jgi:hypothetical protein
MQHLDHQDGMAWTWMAKAEPSRHQHWRVNRDVQILVVVALISHFGLVTVAVICRAAML